MKERRKFTDRERQEILGRAKRLVQEGKTRHEAAKECGVWDNYLTKWEKKFGSGTKKKVRAYRRKAVAQHSTIVIPQASNNVVIAQKLMAIATEMLGAQ